MKPVLYMVIQNGIYRLTRTALLVGQPGKAVYLINQTHGHLNLNTNIYPEMPPKIPQIQYSSIALPCFFMFMLLFLY